MATFYRFAADALVVVHFSYVAFVVIGLLAILLGLICRWGWVAEHLVSIPPPAGDLDRGR
jgi:hypothetical protein